MICGLGNASGLLEDLRRLNAQVRGGAGNFLGEISRSFQLFLALMEIRARLTQPRLAILQSAIGRFEASLRGVLSRPSFGIVLRAYARSLLRLFCFRRGFLGTSCFPPIHWI